MERRRKDGGTRKVMLESLRSGPREAGREMFQLHRQQLDGSSYNNNAAAMIITREMRGGRGESGECGRLGIRCFDARRSSMVHVLSR